MTVLHDDQRIDLEQAHVLVGEGLVERREHRRGIGAGGPLEPKRRDDPGDVGIGDPDPGIDVDGDDPLGRVVGNGLDIHAAFGRDDEGDLAGLAIDEQRAVELARDVGAVLDIEAVDGLAGGAGLFGDERMAEHFFGVGNHFGG